MEDYEIALEVRKYRWKRSHLKSLKGIMMSSTDIKDTAVVSVTNISFICLLKDGITAI